MHEAGPWKDPFSLQSSVFCFPLAPYRVHTARVSSSACAQPSEHPSSLPGGPFPHHSHGANSQHLKTRSTASSGTCYFTCTCPSPSFLPLLSTPLLLEAPPVSAAVPLTQMYLCAAFPDFHLGCSASQHPQEHGGDFYLTPQCQDSCLPFPQ